MTDIKQRLAELKKEFDERADGNLAQYAWGDVLGNEIVQAFPDIMAYIERLEAQVEEYKKEYGTG